MKVRGKEERKGEEGGMEVMLNDEKKRQKGQKTEQRVDERSVTVLRVPYVSQLNILCSNRKIIE